MKTELREILWEHGLAIVDTIGSASIIILSFWLTIFVHRLFDGSITGLDVVWLWLADFIAGLTLVIPPALRFYRKVILMWIETQRDIKKAQERADK